MAATSPSSSLTPAASFWHGYCNECEHGGGDENKENLCSPPTRRRNGSAACSFADQRVVLADITEQILAAERAAVRFVEPAPSPVFVPVGRPFYVADLASNRLPVSLASGAVASSTRYMR